MENLLTEKIDVVPSFTVLDGKEISQVEISELTLGDVERLSRPELKKKPTEIILEYLLASIRIDGAPLTRAEILQFPSWFAEYLIFRIRLISVGTEYDLNEKCVSCKKVFDGVIDISKQKFTPPKEVLYSLPLNSPEEFTKPNIPPVVVGKLDFSLPKLQSQIDINNRQLSSLNTMSETEVILKTNKVEIELEIMFKALMNPEKSQYSREFKELFRKLNLREYKKIINFLQGKNSGLETAIVYTCENCSEENSFPFNVLDFLA